jgi:rubrerythrin
MKKNKALEFAYDFELKGVNLYMKLAAAIDNVLAKEVFYSLAKQEVDHARRIDEIYAGLKSNKGWRTASMTKLPAMEKEIKKFFSGASRAQLKKGAENLEGYEMAMRMERKGYIAYKEFFASAQTQGEKAFFRQMMAEENGHYETLANVYAYLTNTADWLQEDESRTWNWMNT